MHIGHIGGDLLLYRAAVRGIRGICGLAGADPFILLDAGRRGNSADRRVYGHLRGAAEKISQHKSGRSGACAAELFHEHAADQRRYARNDRAVHAADVRENIG